MSDVTCHVPRVMCHVFPIDCHLSLTPIATATEPAPANSPTMHSGPVRKDAKSQKNQDTKIIEVAKKKTLR